MGMKHLAYTFIRSYLLISFTFIILSLFASLSFAEPRPQQNQEAQNKRIQSRDIRHNRGFDEKSQAKQFKIEKIQIREISNSKQYDRPQYDLPINFGCIYQPCYSAGPRPNSVITDIGNIVAIGQKIWTIIEANKPTSKITTNSVAAIPSEVERWDQMHSWKGPQFKSYQLTAVNQLGWRVIDIEYEIMDYYDGKYEGRGHYLTNLSMVAKNVFVAPGFNLEATAELTDLVNTSTNTDDPVPGCTLQMKWKISSAFTINQGTHSVFARGDGLIQDVSQGR